MKIPESNITCQFHYQLYNGAKSVKDVPFWRLYMVKLTRRETLPVLYKRTYISKTTCNYTFEELCKLLRNIGPVKQLNNTDTRYFYAAYPRKTEHNIS